MILESFPELTARELASAVRIARCRTSAWQHRRTGTADECMSVLKYGTSVSAALLVQFSMGNESSTNSRESRGREARASSLNASSRPPNQLSTASVPPPGGKDRP